MIMPDIDIKRNTVSVIEALEAIAADEKDGAAKWHMLLAAQLLRAYWNKFNCTVFAPLVVTEGKAITEAVKLMFYNMDSNGDPVGAQPETSWERGYAAGLRFAYRVMKEKGVDLSAPSPQRENVSIPLALAKSLADGADSLAVWELRGLLERLEPQNSESTK